MNSKNIKKFKSNIKNVLINEINLYQFINILEDIKEKLLIKSCLFFYLRFSYLYSNEGNSLENSGIEYDEEINTLNAIYRLNLIKNILIQLIYIFKKYFRYYFNFLILKLKEINFKYSKLKKKIYDNKLINMSLFIKKKKFLKRISIINPLKKSNIYLKRLFNFKSLNNLNYQIKKYSFQKLKTHPNIYIINMIQSLNKYFKLKNKKREFLSKIFLIQNDYLTKILRNELIKYFLNKKNRVKIGKNNIIKYLLLWERDVKVPYELSEKKNRVYISKVLYFYQIIKQNIIIIKNKIFSQILRKSIYNLEIKYKNLTIKNIIYKKWMKEKMNIWIKKCFFVWKNYRDYFQIPYNNNLENKNKILIRKQNNSYIFKIFFQMISQFLRKKKIYYLSYFFQSFSSKYFHNIKCTKKLIKAIKLLKQFLLKRYFIILLFSINKKKVKKKSLNLSKHYYLYRNIYFYYIMNKYRNKNKYKFPFNIILKKWYFRILKISKENNILKKEDQNTNIFKLKIKDYIESIDSLNKKIEIINQNIKNCKKCRIKKLKKAPKIKFEKFIYENKTTDNELNMSIKNDEFIRNNFIPFFEVKHKNKISEYSETIINDEESIIFQTSKNNDIISEINFNDNDNTMEQYIQYLYNYEEEIKKDFLDLQNKYEPKIDEIQNEINILIQEIDELSK